MVRMNATRCVNLSRFQAFICLKEKHLEPAQWRSQIRPQSQTICAQQPGGRRERDIGLIVCAATVRCCNSRKAIRAGRDDDQPASGWDEVWTIYGTQPGREISLPSRRNR